MKNEFDPVVGNWYAYLGKGQRFLVTAVDERNVVEVQHFDGDVEEIEWAEWRQLELELTEEPENWTGSLDVAERDDLGTEVTDTDDADWSEPFTQFRNPDEERLSPKPEEAEDEWAEGVMAEVQTETEK